MTSIFIGYTLIPGHQIQYVHAFTQRPTWYLNIVWHEVRYSQGIVAGRDYVLMNVSFLGPYLFTTELLPLLKMTARQAPGVQIVNVSIIAPNMNIKHSLVCRNN